MYSRRDEFVRHEQNMDAQRKAEAHRLAKQLPQSGRRFAFVSNSFGWLRSKIFRFKPTLDAANQTPAIEHEEIHANIGFAQSEALAAQE